MEVDQRPNGHLVLVGATASGKSALALEVARQRPGTELVSVDSMAVYRSMDIGTATPTATERDEVPHHLIDLVDPSEEFTVSMFQAAALSVLEDLDRRRCRAVLVGGTGLHVRAVVDELDIPPRFPKVRALEVTLGVGRPFSSVGPGLGGYPPTPFTQVGIRMPRDILDRRIGERYRRQMESGFLDEVAALGKHSEPLSSTAAQALGYRQFLAYLRGDCDLEEAVDAAVAATRRFARRQDRWFRRDPRIDWIDIQDNPLDALPEVLDRFDRCALGAANGSFPVEHGL